MAPTIAADMWDLLDSLFSKAKKNCMLLLDTAGNVLHINKAFSNSFGYQPEDVTGRPFSIFFTADDCEKGLPDLEIQCTLKQGESSDNNYFVSKNGSKTWVSGESLRWDQHGDTFVIKLVQDIHAQKEADNALNTQHIFNECTLSALRDPVIVVDEDQTIIKINDAGKKLFSHAAKDENFLFAALIPQIPSYSILHDQLHKSFSSDSNFSNVMIEISQENEKRIFVISGTLFKAAETKINLLLVFHDVTFFKDLERNREDLIGFVAHELRNPLSNLGLSTELLESALVSKNEKDMQALIQRNKNNILRLNKMISELYSATKLSSGHVNLERGPYHFGDMINESIDTISLLQPDYKTQLTGFSNFIVHGDRYRMIEVVTNYLSNAIKYSNGNTTIELHVERDDRHVTVAVRDYGLGISSSQLPHIFERFFRAEKTKNLEGLGLGLYFCHGIITAHGGKVWAESAEGEGSTFYFSVPVDELTTI